MYSQIAIARAVKLVLESRESFETGSRRQTRKSGQGAVQKPVSVRQAAAIFGVAKSTVQKGIARRHGDIGRIGRPRLLSDDEDDAIAAYVIWLQQSGFPASKAHVESAALSLLQRRNPDAKPPSRAWYSQWLQDHPELRVTYIKAVEKSRKTFEAGDISNVKRFFEKLTDIITTHGISPSEIWNEDECGIRIGSLRERVHVIVSCTLVAAANAVGDTIPPWLVFHTFPCESWGQIDAPGDVRFARSDTGFSNSEITLDWIHQFNVWSWKHSARAQRTGKTLSEWFGVDEWSRELEYPFQEVNPRVIPEDERIHRLLIIDGFTGHTGIDFIQYCIKFDIVLAIFPPHSTHILQPLDVGVFQPLKHAQQKAIRNFIDKGDLNFTRLDFLESFWETFSEGFSRGYVMSGFEKTGIFPPTHEPAVKRIVEEQLKLRQAVNPAYASLLPKETRFEQAVDTVRHIKHRYNDLLSSPTRNGLSNVTRTVTEASLLALNLAKQYQDRLQRIEKMSNRLKRGKTVKASEGTFYTSVSLEDIRKAAERTQQLEAEKSQRQQLLSIRDMIRKEKKQLLDEYRKNKRQVINGKEKTLNIKQWLDFKGKSEEFLALESGEETYRRLLKRPDPFFIDTTRREIGEAEREAANKACASARPLRTMQWPHLQRERSVEIITSRNTDHHEPHNGPDGTTINPLLNIDLMKEIDEEIDRALSSSPPSSPPASPTPRIPA
ncbi:DDE superfamily endonuclease [Hirsutella rhossiliensis]